MRPILFLVAALAASTAMASVKLPVSGTYGTGNACALYKAGGTNAVVSGGGSIGLADTADNSMLVSPDEILGLEWGCQATIVTGNTALLACSGEGDEWTSEATLDEANRTLTLTLDDRVTTLKRCD